MTATTGTPAVNELDAVLNFISALIDGGVKTINLEDAGVLKASNSEDDEPVTESLVKADSDVEGLDDVIPFNLVQDSADGSRGVFEFPVPGFSREDLYVSKALNADGQLVLTVMGSGAEDDDRDLVVHGWSKADFHVDVPLPVGVDVEYVELEHGVLRVYVLVIETDCVGEEMIIEIN